MRIDTLNEFMDADLSDSIVHGDLSCYNLMFNRDGLVAVLDWEEVNVSHSVLDLAYLAVSHSFPQGQFSDPMFRTLIDAYNRVRGLGPDERHYLHLAAHFVVCTILTWILARSIDQERKLSLMPIYDHFQRLDLDGIRLD